MNREMIQKLGKGEDEVTLAIVWCRSLGSKKMYVLREAYAQDESHSRSEYDKVIDPSESLFPWTDVIDADLQHQDLDKINWKVVYRNAAIRLLKDLQVVGSMCGIRYIEQFNHGITRHLFAIFFETMPTTPNEFAVHQNEFTPMHEIRLDSGILPLENEFFGKENQMLVSLAARVRLLSKKNLI